jgi:hypothetical protein
MDAPYREASPKDRDPAVAWRDLRRRIVVHLVLPVLGVPLVVLLAMPWGARCLIVLALLVCARAATRAYLHAFRCPICRCAFFAGSQPWDFVALNCDSCGADIDTTYG